MKKIKLNILQLFILVFCSIVALTSCSKENNEVKEINKDIKFISELRNNDFGEYSLINNSNNYSKVNNEKIKILDNVSQNTINNISTVGDLINSGLNYKMVEFCDDPSCLTTPDDTTDDQASLIASAKQYLYNLGYNDADILEILDGEDESLLIALVTEIEAVRQMELNAVLGTGIKDMPYLSFIDEFNNLAQSTDPNAKLPQAVICAVEAIGLDVIYAFASEGIEKLAKKSLKKAIKKLATKFLGPVGIGIVVAEFAWCIYTNS